MTLFADLHIHTNYSDSSLTPEEVVQESLNADLKCIAITDHDTFEGVAPAQKAADSKNLEIISGIEFSSELDGKDIHILGYCLDCKNKTLLDKIEEMQNTRVARIEKMIEKLKGVGIDNISLDEVCSLTKTKSVGRPHLAFVLKEKKWVSSIREAFDRFLADDAVAYVKKYKQTPVEAINLIRLSGGVAVLAHPMSTRCDEIIPGLVKAGLQGLEVYYPNWSRSVIEYYEKIGKKNNLILTGGSDAHGEGKDNTFIGKAKVPYEVVEQLKAMAGK
ncbi:MAG: PHP domain-containing protein [Candidatus Omnitrophica bacterium]|nr:PHP domain-containing protein [Candidatus Omnitrophota bacterium]